MDVNKAIKERRTIHKYLPQEVPKEAITRALEAALFAPNHKLTYPWRFTLLGKETRNRLVELAFKLKKATEEAVKEKIRAKLLNPATIVAVGCIPNEDPFRQRENYAAVVCSIHNLMLSLWGEGIGSKWSTGEISRHDETYQILGISKKDQEIIGFVSIGVPESVPKPSKKPDLKEVVRELP